MCWLIVPTARPASVNIMLVKLGRGEMLAGTLSDADESGGANQPGSAGCRRWYRRLSLRTKYHRSVNCHEMARSFNWLRE